jgi:hypothetical protein
MEAAPCGECSTTTGAASAIANSGGSPAEQEVTTFVSGPETARHGAAYDEITLCLKHLLNFTV